MVPFPMRVNNQRLFQEFALQTPKLNGFTVQPRTQGKIPRPVGRKRTAKAVLGSGLALGYDTFHITFLQELID